MTIEKQEGLPQAITELLHDSGEQTGKKYLRSLKNAAVSIREHLESEISQAHSILNSESSQVLAPGTELQASITLYEWSEQAKNFFLLWRDVYFEQSKAGVLLTAGKTDEVSVEQLRTKSNQILLQAANDLSDYTEKRTSLYKDEKKRETFLKQTRHQNSPKEVYAEQYLEIEKQISDISDSTTKLSRVIGDFERISDFTRKHIIDCQSEISEVENSLQEIIQFVEDNAEETPGKIVKYLEEIEQKNSGEVIYPTKVAAQIKDETEDLPLNTTVPVQISGGRLQTKEINFRRNTRQWLESEILPQLYEVWEITENTRTGLKLSLLNIKNRALLKVNELKESGDSEVSKEDLCGPLREFKVSAEQREKECKDIYETVNARLKEEFKVTGIYGNTEGFLEVPLQKTLNSLVFSQNDWLQGLKKSYTNFLNKIRAVRTDVAREEALSLSEKVVRYLEARAPDANNHQYSAIFLTKGYVGESFRVGREEEIKRMGKLIQQWQAGYRGAVLLTGQRFSGKTLFGDLTAEKFFPGNSITLFPNYEIKVEGRSFQTDKNLKKALDFIKKYTLTSKSMLWIDNLEVWADDKISLAENIRALEKFTDDFSGKIFVVVSLSNWLKNHLDKHLDFSRYFQAEINLDKMPGADVHRAIAIRHGATHKKLTDAEGEVIGARAFQKLTGLVYRQAEGNIGEALLTWTNSLQRTGKDTVQRTSGQAPPLPDFLSSDTALILVTLLMKKRSNEYELSKLFGSPWQDKYRSILQRLMSLGLVSRSPDGRLEVNEYAVNDLGRLLDKHRYLKFEKK